MKMPFTLCLAAIIGVLGATTLRADVVTQNFNDFERTELHVNPGTVALTNGWTINEVHIDPPSGPSITPHAGTNTAYLPNPDYSGVSATNSYVETPLLSNGVGQVTFYLQNFTGNEGTGPFTCELRTSTNDTDWVTVATFDNSGKTGWIGYTNTLNIYAPVRLRLFRDGSATANASWLALDDIATTDTPAKVDISDLAIAPASPETGDSVSVSAAVEPSAQATISNVGLLWAANGGTSNAINMSLNGGTGRYETDTPIPSQPAFTEIDYTLAVTFSGPGAVSPARASDRFFFRQAPPQSAYSNVTVNGDLTNALELVEDGYWTAAQGVTARGATDLRFESYDGVTTTQWRDPAPSQTVLPLSGSLTASAASDIRIDSTDAGWLLYSFDETAETYAIAQAEYQSFNGWSIASSFTNITLDGWALTRGRAINDASALDGYSLQFQNTTSDRAIAAPALTNGIGFIQFQYRNTETNGLNPAAFAIQTRASASDAWSTQATVTDIISPDYLFYRLEINRFEWKYARLVATGPATGQLLIDNLAVSTLEYPADVTIVDHGVAPAAPRSGEPVTFFTQLDATAPTTGTNATLALSVDGSPLSNLTLTYNSGSGRFETTLPTNLPALVTIDYTLTVSFTGPHADILSPKTATGDFYLRTAVPQSPYSSVSLAGDLTTPLALATNNYWIGVVPVGALSNIALYFESVNGTTTLWNDPTPLRTSLPVFGQFALSTNAADNIAIDATEAGWLLTTFDENSGRYGIQQADYQSFNTWSNAITFGSRTIDDWTLTQGRTTTNASLAYDGYSVQFEGVTTERAIESPALTNGIGTIAFRYRNTETNILSPAAFAIQVRATTGASWTTVETVTGIVSPDYRYHSYTVASLDLRYVRIAALNGTAAAQLLIDDIIVTRPGATVAFSGLTNTPPSPTILDTVDVSVDITALNGAELNGANLFFRAGNSGIYDSIAMTTNSVTQYTATIPRGARGLMQYYVEAIYLNPATGSSQATQNPVEYTVSPAAYTNTNVTLGSQNFNDFQETTLYVNPGTVALTNGWTINEVHIDPPGIPIAPHAGTNTAFLPDQQYSGVSAANSYVETPLLGNGVGQVTFYLQNVTDGGGQGPFTCELRINTNGTDWVTVATFDNSGKTGWIGYTSTLNIDGPVRLRLFRDGSATADSSWLAVDDISLTYPPAFVTAGGYDMHPAYPAASEPVSVYATITSATSFHPAFNITGAVEYRVKPNLGNWGSWLEAALERVNHPFGDEYVGQIPGQADLTDVEYRFRADFKGYSAAGSDQSPMTFTSTNFQYRVREYVSPYERLGLSIDGTDIQDFEQRGDGEWEAVIRFTDPTNSPSFTIDGYGYYDGSTVNSGLSISWGDNSQTATNVPLFGTAADGGAAITIPGQAEGQYVIRFDEDTGEYTVQLAVFQDFENWPADNILFGESYAAAEITTFTQEFTSWPLSDTKVRADDFTDPGWTNILAYPDNWSIDGMTETKGLDVNYTIQSGILVTQLVGRAAALLKPAQGYLYSNDLIKEDVGTWAFDLRAASPNNFRPAIHPEVTNTSMRIQATLKATDMPTNSSLDSIGYAYKSIIGNYINENNYYEARVVQMSANTKRYELWKKVGGTLSRLGNPSSTYSGSITDDNESMSLRFWLPTNKIRFTYKKSATQWENLDRTDSSLTAAYAFGFNGMDASLSVDNVKVFAVTNSSFEYDSTSPVYEENFDSGAIGWDGSDIWQRNAGNNRYERPGYTGDPITARIEYATNLAGPWQELAVFTNITHNYFKRYEVFPHIPTNGYVRVWHFAGDGGGYLMVDNVYRDGWSAKNQTSGNWEIANVWIGNDGKTGRGMEMRHSRVLGGASQNIDSPALAGGASVVAFDYRAAEDATGPVSFEIKYQLEGSTAWFTLTSFSDAAAINWTPYAYGITDRSTALDIRRIRVRNTTPGYDDGLLIDNIVITAPPPINETTWWGYNVLVTDQQPTGIVDTAASPWRLPAISNDFGAFLNNSFTNGTGGEVYTNPAYAFIQSAYMEDGIGEIRFRYRAWDETPSTIQVVSSTNRLTPALDWTVLDTLTNVVDTAWQEYRNYVFDRENNYVALRINPGSGSPGRVGIENILITAPLAASVRMRNVQTDPAIPLYFEEVHVEVEVYDLFLNPTDIELRLYYQTGTNNWGAFPSPTFREMELIESIDGIRTYRTLESQPIPASNVKEDSVVQYQVKATFNGFFATESSPQEYREFETPEHYYPLNLNRNQANQTPYYLTLSSLPGQIWINEIDIVDSTSGGDGRDNQFIELVGVNDLSIADWKIENIDAVDFSTNLTITLPSYTFDGVTNFGFFVIGTTNITPRNMDLPSPLDYSGGLQLVRPIGIIDQQISYDDPWGNFYGDGEAMAASADHKFIYVGMDDGAEHESLSLTGAGKQSSEMTWTNTAGFTVGTTNVNQTLIPWPTNGPVIPGEYTGTATIGSAWRDAGLGRVYFDVSTEATNLVPSVWYVTNLLNVTSNDWQQQTNGFISTRSNTTYHVECDEVPPPVFYRIGVSVAP